MPKQILVVREVPETWCQHRRDRLTKFNKICEREFNYCKGHAKQLKNEIKNVNKNGCQFKAEQLPHVVEEKRLKYEQYKKTQILFQYCRAGMTSTAQEKLNDLFEASVEWVEKLLWLVDNNIIKMSNRHFVDDDGVDRQELIKGQEIYRRACDREKELNEYHNNIIEILMDVWENECCSTESADEEDEPVEEEFTEEEEEVDPEEESADEEETADEPVEEEIVEEEEIDGVWGSKEGEMW